MNYDAKGKEGFSHRFENRYGEGSVAIFKKIIENPYSSLADAARYFEFSRENARIVHTKIYGFPYTETYMNKLEKKRRDREEQKLMEGVEFKKSRKYLQFREAWYLLANR